MKRLRNELVGIYDVSSQRINKTVNNKKMLNLISHYGNTEKQQSDIIYYTYNDYHQEEKNNNSHKSEENGISLF